MNQKKLLLFIVFILGVYLQAGFTAEFPPDYWKGEKVAKVWYLHHCGYAVQTENHFLIFDYWEPEENIAGKGLRDGVINPSEIKDLKVRVLVTHSHSDHYDKRILEWQKDISDIKYFFGWDNLEGKKYTNMPAPRTQYRDKNLKIFTVNSHHSGVPEVAFLVQVDGLDIFHEGDYQGRMVRKGAMNVVEDMKFLRKEAGLGEDKVDMAFIGAYVGDFTIAIMQGLEPEIIFPTHSGKDIKEYQEFAEDCKTSNINFPVFVPEHRGDQYTHHTK